MNKKAPGSFPVGVAINAIRMAEGTSAVYWLMLTSFVVEFG
jgi:hypothetical protein